MTLTPVIYTKSDDEDEDLNSPDRTAYSGGVPSAFFTFGSHGLQLRSTKKPTSVR